MWMCMELHGWSLHASLFTTLCRVLLQRFPTADSQPPGVASLITVMVSSPLLGYGEVKLSHGICEHFSPERLCFLWCSALHLPPFSQNLLQHLDEHYKIKGATAANDWAWGQTSNHQLDRCRASSCTGIMSDTIRQSEDESPYWLSNTSHLTEQYLMSDTLQHSEDESPYSLSNTTANVKHAHWLLVLILVLGPF